MENRAKLLQEHSLHQGSHFSQVSQKPPILSSILYSGMKITLLTPKLLIIFVDSHMELPSRLLHTICYNLHHKPRVPILLILGDRGLLFILEWQVEIPLPL